jgi:glycosyltransferase involved in cell wall biosynthesis
MKILTNSYREKKNRKVLAGGPRNFVALMTAELNRSGHQIIGLSIHGKKKVDNKFLFRQEVSGKNPSWFLKLRLNLSDIYDAKKAVLPQSLEAPLAVITSAIKEINPDVVLLNGFSIINWFILRAAHNLDLPVMVVHHGLWFKEFSNVREQGLSQATAKIFREMEKDAARFADQQVFLNEFSRQEFSKNLIKPRSGHSSIIPLPYNPLFKKPGKKVLTQKFFNTDKIKIGTVSRWDPVKAPEKFLALAKEAKKQKLPWEFYAVINLKYNYSKLAKAKKEFSKYVHVIRQLPQEELKSFYRHMDTLIVPSNFDVSPTVVMEAALEGRPTAISQNVGWVSEYRQVGAGEWVMDFDQPAKALKTISSLLGFKKNSFSKLAKQIESKHNHKAVFAAYDKVLKRIVR